jgi:hypothetical protein
VGIESPTATVSAVQPAAQTSIVIAIPEDPPSFNASVGDTGYDALVMELALLGLADLDPDGKAFPELAAVLGYVYIVVLVLIVV